MDAGECLTRVTVWLALTLYVASEFAGAVRAGHKQSEIAWWLNATGCAFFLAHVACAFDFFYDWSHATAYADTARQTKEFTGWNSGSGLYINYAFALVWMAEVIWSGVKPFGYSARSNPTTYIVRVFFLFMIINGAFVFVRGNIRWFGLLLCVALVGCWWFRPNRRIDPRPPSKSS